jgi:gliding motility-associated lipoprotein GldH
LYNEYRALNRNGWHRDSIVQFQVLVEDSTSRFDLFLQTRYSGRLERSNLWMVIDTYGPDSSRVSTDTVEIKLADEWGNRRGTGSGPAIDVQALYRPNLVFQQPGTYRFVLQHIMRDPVVSQLTHIGFRIAYKNGKK